LKDRRAGIAQGAAAPKFRKISANITVALLEMVYAVPTASRPADARSTRKVHISLGLPKISAFGIMKIRTLQIDLIADLGSAIGVIYSHERPRKIISLKLEETNGRQGQEQEKSQRRRPKCQNQT
jgi:hypothetical protein